MATTTEITNTNTQYRVYITSHDINYNPIKYNVTGALVSLDFSEQKGQMAVCATIELCDVEVNGSKLSSIIAPPDVVTIGAVFGQNGEEVFRGFIWDISPKESLTDGNITIKCYDQLIYWQESEDSLFFAAGKTTKSIMDELAKDWGFTLSFEYENIKHEQLVLRGAIADFVTADVLDPIQKSTGKKYTILSEKGKVLIRHVGSNKTVYTISKAQNATELRRYITMNGVVTRVIIIGTADDDGKSAIEASLNGNTSKYGTLQKIITKSEDTDISKSKAEAKSIIKTDGTPKWEYDIKAVDIPFIRKGDRVNIDTDTIKGTFNVESISREISNRGKVMSLTVTK